MFDFQKLAVYQKSKTFCKEIYSRQADSLRQIV